MTIRLIGLAALVLLAACQSVPETYDVNARIVSPDAASRAALQSAVDRAIGVSVTMSDTALTDASILTVEHTPRPTMENPAPQGRVMTMPRQFRLVKNGESCILIDQSDRSRYELADTRCEPE